MYILRISFQSFKPIRHLRKSFIKLQEIQKIRKTQVSGVFKPKKRKKIITLLKSPHVNKKAREQFIYENYKAKIDLKFKNIFKLFNFLILVKKRFGNLLIHFKILKKTCL